MRMRRMGTDIRKKKDQSEGKVLVKKELHAATAYVVLRPESAANARQARMSSSVK